MINKYHMKTFLVINHCIKPYFRLEKQIEHTKGVIRSRKSVVEG